MILIIIITKKEILVEHELFSTILIVISQILITLIVRNHM